MGDHVKVIGGRYENDTGLIVRVEENMVVLFSDLTMHEVSFVSFYPADKDSWISFVFNLDDLDFKYFFV